MADTDPWWVNGLLYENCNCQLLCPAHVSFKQTCDEDPCVGFWGVHVKKGRYGQLTLDEQDAVVMYHSPPLMHSVGWKVKIFLDGNVDEEQRNAIDRIIKGEVGGPWKILGKFVAERFESQVAAIHFEDDGKQINLRVEGVLQSTISSIESRRSGRTATIDNLFNVIHSGTQYLATGSSFVNEQDFRWTTERKHALYSEFSWAGP